MNYFPNDLVLPLRLAEPHLLQLLIEDFNLTRSGPGVELEVHITPDTPTIWTRDAKRLVLSKMKAMPGYPNKVISYHLDPA